MKKFIEVNGNWLFNDEHFLLTERGWLKAKELQNGDKVICVKGKSTIKNIIECGERLYAPIIGEPAAVGN